MEAFETENVQFYWASIVNSFCWLWFTSSARIHVWQNESKILK